MLGSVSGLVAAERAAVDAALAGVFRAPDVASCAEASELARARARSAAGHDVVYRQGADAAAALRPRAIEMTVLTFTRDRGSARPLAGAVELQQVHRTSDARATRVAPGARDVAVALADHLALARALTLAADVALGVRAADHVLLARAVATTHITRPPRGADDLLVAAAARLVAVEEARALEAAATATQTDVTAAVVVGGRLHDTTAAASRVARSAASRACSGIGILRRDHASATAFTGVARLARRARRSRGRSC